MSSPFIFKRLEVDGRLGLPVKDVGKPISMTAASAAYVSCARMHLPQLHRAKAAELYHSHPTGSAQLMQTLSQGKQTEG